MMPHTGVNPRYECLENGTFILIGALEDVPTCVPKQSCRLPEFPKNASMKWGYTHNDESKGNTPLY